LTDNPQHLGLKDINSKNFESVALTIFKYQAEYCPVYRDFLKHLKVDVPSIKKVEDIPYLPIAFFKSHEVISEKETANTTFKSSGTTGQTTSKHMVADIALYEESFNTAFEYFYGHPKDYCILGLLPSYIEQGDSSLVYMVDHLIKRSEHMLSGFYLHNYEKLRETLVELEKTEQKTILFGVSYALLDMAEDFPTFFDNLIIIETGGMKGKRKEIIREELHHNIGYGFGTKNIHSEYGMTELLSQAYSMGDETFQCPPWMKVTLKDLHDPKSVVRQGKTGRIHVIDLANINSCSFIATNDLGQQVPNGQFKVLGRVDHSDIRGCNLMVV